MFDWRRSEEGDKGLDFVYQMLEHSWDTAAMHGKKGEKMHFFFACMAMVEGVSISGHIYFDVILMKSLLILVVYYLVTNLHGH